MFTPSLTLVLCMLAPAVALWQTLRKTAPHMPYVYATAPLAIAAIVASVDSLPVWVGRNVLNGSIQVDLSYQPPLAQSLLLLLCAALLWLQRRKNLLFYPAFTRALAAPMSLAAAAMVPLAFASPYLFGIFKWEFASPAVKTAGVIGIACMALATLALLAFITQLVASLLKALRGQRSTP